VLECVEVPCSSAREPHPGEVVRAVVSDLIAQVEAAAEAARRAEGDAAVQRQQIHMPIRCELLRVWLLCRQKGWDQQLAPEIVRACGGGGCTDAEVQKVHERVLRERTVQECSWVLQRVVSLVQANDAIDRSDDKALAAELEEPVDILGPNGVALLERAVASARRDPTDERLDCVRVLLAAFVSRKLDPPVPRLSLPTRGACELVAASLLPDEQVAKQAIGDAVKAAVVAAQQAAVQEAAQGGRALSKKRKDPNALPGKRELEVRAAARRRAVHDLMDFGLRGAVLSRPIWPLSRDTSGFKGRFDKRVGLVRAESMHVEAQFADYVAVACRFRGEESRVFWARVLVARWNLFLQGDQIGIIGFKVDGTRHSIMNRTGLQAVLDVSTGDVEAYLAKNGALDSRVEGAALEAAICQELADLGHPCPCKAMLESPPQTRAPALSLNRALDAGADGGGS